MDANALRAMARRALKREGLAGRESGSQAMERVRGAAAATAAGRRFEEADDLDAAYRAYQDAAAADPQDGEPWYDMARVLINANALISTEPQDAAAYPVALDHLHQAIARGHEHATAVEEVLRGFSALFADDHP